MKLGICAFPLSKGRETGRGLELVVEELVSGLDSQGVEYSFYDRGIIRNEFAAVAHSLLYLRRLLSTKDDLYFAIYPVAALFPLILGKRPVVTAVYDLIPFLRRGYDNGLKYFIKRLCIRYACRHSDKLIVPFASTAQSIVQMFGIPPQRIEVIPLGINHDRFFLDDTVKKQEYRIGFLGEAKRAKGLDTAILAFAKVAAAFPEAFFAIASNGNELEEMKSLAKAHLPSGRYEFVGFVPDEKVREFYAECDVFLFPSRYGFGMSAVEAAACGTPSIVGKTLDATDFFDNPLSLVNPNSADELADRISYLFRNRTEYDALKQWGLSAVRTMSWDRMAERYRVFWRQTYDGGRRKTGRTGPN